MNSHIYSTLFKTQERKSDRRSKEIEQRNESQKTQKQKQGHVLVLYLIESMEYSGHLYHYNRLYIIYDNYHCEQIESLVGPGTNCSTIFVKNRET